jgi:hypothetical protein
LIFEELRQKPAMVEGARSTEQNVQTALMDAGSRGAGQS